MNGPILAEQRSWMTWTGRVLTGLIVAFLAFDTGIKLMQLPMVLETFTSLGYSADVAFPIGVIELICLILYVVPRTSVLGAILLTAICGGGIASHIRLDHPLFSHVLFGVYLGLFVWGGLFFRNARVRAMIPFLS